MLTHIEELIMVFSHFRPKWSHTCLIGERLLPTCPATMESNPKMCVTVSKCQHMPIEMPNDASCWHAWWFSDVGISDVVQTSFLGDVPWLIFNTVLRFLCLWWKSRAIVCFTTQKFTHYRCFFNVHSFLRFTFFCVHKHVDNWWLISSIHVFITLMYLW